mgnify:FL=1
MKPSDLTTFKVLTIDMDWCQSHFHVKKVNQLFYRKIPDAKRIVFGRHHHQIIPEIINEDNIILHNLDDHHDIQYKPWQITDMVGEPPMVTHGCWVGMMMLLKKIKEYYWYINHDSLVDFTDWTHKVVYQHNEGMPFCIEEDVDKAHQIESYDLIFVAHSPEYARNYSTYAIMSALYQSYMDCCLELYSSKTAVSTLITNLKNTPIKIEVDGQSHKLPI